jgi:hypothetical protein
VASRAPNPPAPLRRALLLGLHLPASGARVEASGGRGSMGTVWISLVPPVCRRVSHTRLLRLLHAPLLRRPHIHGDVDLRVRRAAHDPSSSVRSSIGVVWHWHGLRTNGFGRPRCGSTWSSRLATSSSAPAPTAGSAGTGEQQHLKLKAAMASGLRWRRRGGVDLT